MGVHGLLQRYHMPTFAGAWRVRRLRRLEAILADGHTLVFEIPTVHRRPRCGNASLTVAPLRRTSCAIRVTSSSRRLDQGAKMRAQGALPVRGFGTPDELRSGLRAGSSVSSCLSGRNGPRSAGFSRCVTRICWTIRAERSRGTSPSRRSPLLRRSWIVLCELHRRERAGRDDPQGSGLDNGISQPPRMVL